MAKQNSTEFDQAMATLKKVGLKRTKTRETLIAFLIQEHGPYSIEEIYQALKRKELDLVTVYRCLAAFEKIGLARRCDFGDGIARFEFQLDPRHHHHHVICTSCRKSVTLETCKLPGLESRVKQLGYSNIAHSLEFFGVCKECQDKSA